MQELRPEKVLKKAVLVYLVKDFNEAGLPQKVLLSFKPKRPDKQRPGEERLNGFGGGPNQRESLNRAAVREVKQESGLKILARDLKKIAIALFHNQKFDGTPWDCEVHVYVVSKWSGEPSSTKEMVNPEWYPINRLPADRLMPADYAWMPTVLMDNRRYRVEAWYEPGQSALVKDKGVEIRVATDGLPD